MSEEEKDNSFPKKWLTKLPTGFTDDVGTMDEVSLKKVIFESESNIYTIDKEKDNDTKLNAAKDLVKDLSIPYRDAKATQTAKIKYCLYLLEGRGANLDFQEES